MEQETIVECAKAVAMRRVHDLKREPNAGDDIAQAAIIRLQSSPYVSLRSVEVEYREGVLVLHGPVKSFFHKQLAQETVRNIEGVGVIVNATAVIQSANGSCEGIASRSMSRYLGEESYVGS